MAGHPAAEERMPVPTVPAERPVRAGALHGAIAWTVYAAIECALLSLVSALLRPDHAAPALHPGFNALTFLFYPALGAVTGAAVALAGRAVGARSIPPAALGALAIVLGFDLHLAHLVAEGVGSPFSFRQSRVHLALPALLSLGVAAAAVVSARAGRCRFVANPWTASLLLVGTPWLTVSRLAQAGPGAKAAAAAIPYTTMEIASSLPFVITQGRSSQ
jgi:hypothetical protein